jgi:hypothetical protein
MRWQEEVFGPLLARTVENAQVQHLAEHYDLARDSRLAQAIVRHVNEVLDAEEKRRQVKRVRPGELVLRTHRGYLVLALRTPEDIARVVAGERLDKVRRDILERAKAQYRELFPEASPKDVERFLRCIWPGYGPRGKTPSALWGPRQKRPWGNTPYDGQPLVELDAEQGRRWVDRDPPRPGHLPEARPLLGQPGRYPACHPGTHDPGPHGYPRPVLPAAHQHGQRPNAPGGHARKVRPAPVAAKPLPAHGFSSGNVVGQ